MTFIKFKVNGVQCTVGTDIECELTLLDYLRKTLELRGTKYMCREGGCGACIVAVTKGKDSTPQAINSCLVLLASCADWSITTIEGIGNRRDGYHPLQKTLAEVGGSQCGYCSPGWVMSMYSLLKTKQMTMVEIEKSLASNVCRCTGYRPILEAFKKFASDAPGPNGCLDIEDLHMCKKSGEACARDCEDPDWCHVSKEDIQDIMLHTQLKGDKDWHRVDNVKDIFSILNQKGTDSYMLVAGNTGKGVYPIDEYPKVLIDITSVSELKGHYVDQNLVIGAGTTLTELADIFKTMSRTDGFNYFTVLNDHLSQVAHIPVKNLGTIAGNLMLKHKNPRFPSDMFVMLAAVGAQVTILYQPGIKKMFSMRSFLKQDMKGKVLYNILLPPLSQQYRLVTHKVMPRSQNAHAIVNCGFLYQLDPFSKVQRCRIVYGGLDPSFVRAFKTEKYLLNRSPFTNETLQEALRILDGEMVVTNDGVERSVKYRRQLALALFYKGLLSLCPPKILKAKYASGALKIHESRPVSSGTQTFDTDTTLWPLNQPIPKLDGLVQCAGEAKYSEDVPTLRGEVFAEFVLATVPLGKIDKIDSSKAMKVAGVIAFYTASDIPGENTFVPKLLNIYLENEEIFCGGNVRYFNQPLGVIVAESPEVAKKAANMIEVTYSDVKKPVIDIKVAKDDPSRNTQFIAVEPTRIGPDVKSTVKGELTVFAQYHFCMETLVCVSHPTEDGMQVYVPSQWPDAIQQMTARALKMDSNSIDVTIPRVGGGFGYKISRATQVAVACNLVVHKLNRPCRFVQSLKNNMRAVGKRLPCNIIYEIGVNDKGVIQNADCKLYSDNGYVFSENLQLFSGDTYRNCYDTSTWKYTSYDTVTDTASNTWCRSPGTLECIAMTEIMMEQIAYELKLDPVEVRLANLDTTNYKDMIDVVETLKTNSDYVKRRSVVDDFNRSSRWKKRGLRFAFMRWSPVAFQNLDINIAVYHVDGTVTVTHGGVEMGQGINTRAIQVCAYLLNIPVEKIKVKANSSITTPNSSISGGSTSSQNVCIGVRRCCEELLKRLEPVRERLQNPPWEKLIAGAYEMFIDLQVHGYVNALDTQAYNVFGATLSEVEVDVLTGESEIIRVDLLEDTGRSVNPDIDIGQVEGAFVMGVGYWTSEELKYDGNTGEVLTDRTWHYWVPQPRDIPQDLRIYFRKGSYSSDIIFGAKATGEPATTMAISIPLAMREAIVAARSESKIPSNKWFEIDGPYTVEKLCLNCATKTEDFKFY